MADVPDMACCYLSYGDGEQLWILRETGAENLDIYAISKGNQESIRIPLPGIHRVEELIRVLQSFHASMCSESRAEGDGMYFPGYKAGVAITPSDTVALTNGVCNAIYVGVAGHIAVVQMNDTVATYSNVPVGIFPVIAKRVNATGTTATTMIAMYA